TNRLMFDNLYQLLSRVEAVHHLSANRPCADARDEVLDHLVVDVGFEQGQPHLPQSRVDVGLAQLAAAGQRLERLVETLGQGLKHARPAPARACARSRRGWSWSGAR